MRTPTPFALALLIAAGAVSADSLYNAPATQTDGRGPINYFADTKAHAVGDIVTVVITETSTGGSSGTTKGTKSESASFGPGLGSVLNLIHQFGLSGNETSSADGSTIRSDNLSATIACTVKAVEPNGNLEIEGTRQVGTNAEKATITLTGVVRPADISSTDSVQSPQVANAQIQYSGKGPVGEIQHDGLVRQIFKYVF
jgi:flagellar L-ring protein precursor FlgH